MDAAAETQSHVPELLGSAARAVSNLFTALREIESKRQDAMHSLAGADRVDYEIELEEGEEHEKSLDRDPRGLAYALAARHGDGRVKKLLEELNPGFGLLEGCNLDDPLYRDVANFVMDRVTGAAAPQAAKKNNGRVSVIQEDPAVPAEPAAPAESVISMESPISGEIQQY